MPDESEPQSEPSLHLSTSHPASHQPWTSCWPSGLVLWLSGWYGILQSHSHSFGVVVVTRLLFLASMQFPIAGYTLVGVCCVPGSDVWTMARTCMVSVCPSPVGYPLP